MSYRSDYEQLTSEVGEIRGVVAAVRDSTFRAEQIANRHAGQLLFRFNEIAEGTKTAALSTSREMHERVANTVKIVESLTSDVKEVQRVQGALDLRLDVELEAGRLAISRATAAAEHADSVAFEL